jgi:hypothetical protein
MTDHPQTPMTHTAWAPFFDDDGNFVRSVEIGYGIFEADANGEVMGGFSGTGKSSVMTAVISVSRPMENNRPRRRPKSWRMPATTRSRRRIRISLSRCNA